MESSFYMKYILIFKLLLTSYVINSQDYPVIPEKCMENQGNKSIKILHQFPGHGWDPLKAEAKNFIFKLTYTKCHYAYSKFGGYNHEFLMVPDQVLLHSAKTKIKNNELYSNDVKSSIEFQKTSSLVLFTSTSGNSDKNLQFERLKGTLSPKFQEWKNFYFSHSGRIVHRRQVAVVRFEANLISKLALNENFVNSLRLLLDEEHWENDYVVLRNLKKFVDTFGTHFVMTGIYGGNAFIDDYARNEIEWESTTDLIESTKVEVLGGNEKLDPDSEEWIESTADKAEVIMWSGEIIHSLLKTRDEFKEYSGIVREKVEKRLEDYIANYYKENTHYGCTLFAAENFDGNANMDDGSCTMTNMEITIHSKSTFNIGLIICSLWLLLNTFY